MLTELCQEIRNWFVRDIYRGTFSVQTDGETSITTIGNAYCVTQEQVVPSLTIQDGQYYRIIGSVFNDGVWQYPGDALETETFTGEIWTMGIPNAVLQLASEIDAWRAKYLNPNSQYMSPYTSESFGGYSYSKGSNLASVTSGNSATGWKATFASELNKWRKL